MDLSLYLKALYHNNIRLTKTKLGLSNVIYRANINGSDVAIRVPNEDISKHLSNEAETLKLIRTTDLDVEEIYYDPKTRIRITKWVNNYQEFKDFDNPDKYIRATRLIKRLHSYHFKVKHKFDVEAMYYAFKKDIQVPLLDYDKYENCFESFKNLKQDYILCHNDVVSGNMLFTSDRDYLIDYEYAGNNHPYFDIMSLITENNIDDENIRNMIYKEYLGKMPDSETLEAFKIIENVQNLLWAAWANMLYDSRHEEIYLTIFNDKIEHLKKGNQ